MKIIKENSPHIHKASSVKRMMIDVLIALGPISIFTIIQYRFKYLLVLALSVFTMLFMEALFCFLTVKKPVDGSKLSLKMRFLGLKERYTINNLLAPLISAVIYALILPSNIAWYIVIIGALFGITIGKLVFGGLGGNIFNPAAVGRVFVMVCFGSALGYLSVKGLSGVDVIASGTALAPLKEGNFSYITWPVIKNLFVGTVSGSFGETGKICILLGGIYLIIRKSADPRPMLAVIGSFMFVMLLAGIKISGVNPLMYMLYQTLSGGLLFGAVFMVTDPVTSPTTRPGRITFGILIGLVAAMIRLFGAYPEGVAFAILIVNMFVPVIDHYKWSSNKYSWKHFLIWGLILGLVSLVIVLAI